MKYALEYWREREKDLQKFSYKKTKTPIDFLFLGYVPFSVRKTLSKSLNFLANVKGE